jgi:hypothetical protein
MGVEQSLYPMISCNLARVNFLNKIFGFMLTTCFDLINIGRWTDDAFFHKEENNKNISLNVNKHKHKMKLNIT